MRTHAKVRIFLNTVRIFLNTVRIYLNTVRIYLNKSAFFLNTVRIFLNKFSLFKKMRTLIVWKNADCLNFDQLLSGYYDRSYISTELHFSNKIMTINPY